MKEAFTYMFKDNAYYKKALIYFVFMFIAEFLIQWGGIHIPNVPNATIPLEAKILLLVGGILMLIPAGYCFSVIKALIKQKENYILPFLGIKNSLIVGLKYFLSVIITIVSILLVFAVLVLIPFIIFLAIASGIGSEIFANIAIIIFAILSIIFVSIFSILYFVCVPAFCSMFAKDKKLTTFIRYISVFKLIKKDAHNYFKYLGMNILVLITCSIVSLILSLVLLLLFKESILFAFLISLFSSIIGSYTVFVFAYLIAKSTKIELAE